MTKELQTIEPQGTELTVMTNVTPIKYSVKPEEIQVRILVEKEREAQKEESIKTGRDIDAAAKRITAMIVAVEEPLKAVKKAYEDEKERVAAEAALKEKERIDVIMATINGIAEYPFKFIGKSSELIQEGFSKLIEENGNSDFNFQEFIGLASKAKEGAIAKFSEIIKECKEFEAEQAADLERKKKAEADRIQLEKEQEKFREEQRIFAEQQAAAKRIEEEKTAADRKAHEDAEHARRTEELKRQAAENARQAAVEAQRLEMERQKLELEKQQATHAAKVLADRAQAEYEEIQRKAAESSLIAQAAPDLLAALKYAKSTLLGLSLSNDPDKVVVNSCLLQIDDALKQAGAL